MSFCWNKCEDTLPEESRALAWMSMPKYEEADKDAVE